MEKNAVEDLELELEVVRALRIATQAIKRFSEDRQMSPMNNTETITALAVGILHEMKRK